MKIDEIALRVAEKLEPRGRTYSPDHYIEFAHALLAELSKDVEPIAFVQATPEGNLMLSEITKTKEYQ